MFKASLGNVPPGPLEDFWRHPENSGRILEGPEHLMCTLMRFKYDRAQGRKSKVFTDVDYELRIRLPVSQVN